MKFEDPILIGELALKKGLINEEQLEEALKYQEKEGGKIGEILIQLGYIQPHDLPFLVSLQGEKFELESWTGRKRRDSMFGQIALKKGFCTEEQVNECLKYQAYNRNNGIYFSLGEYMYRKGYLTEEQVQKILDEQGVKILICSECQSQYNIVQLDPDEVFICKNCHQILEFPEKLESLSVVGAMASPALSVGVLRPSSPWITKAMIPLAVVIFLFALFQFYIFTQNQKSFVSHLTKGKNWVRIMESHYHNSEILFENWKESK
ncbi:MAG: hypothetical protein D6785_16550, partial [Planctomycetota bacterium]